MNHMINFKDQYRTFNVWMHAVNYEIAKIAGVSAEDLCDQTWADWYESEIEPREAALMALEDEGFPVLGDEDMDYIDF